MAQLDGRWAVDGYVLLLTFGIAILLFFFLFLSPFDQIGGQADIIQGRLTVKGGRRRWRRRHDSRGHFGD